jgi:peptidoglycan/xylan/chitin deacetylase (PgdA/CDA1 family)
MQRLSLSYLILVFTLFGCDSGAHSELDDPASNAGGGNPSGGSSAVAGAGQAANAAGVSSTSGGGAPGSGVTCHRPVGMPAVSLTYDDSLSTHLSIVGPALKAHDLKGTFFVMDVRGAPAPWAALRAEGHELGSHTFKHPCPKVNTWVAAGDANEDYDLTRMTTELDDSLALLKQIGQAAPFTFAYPCGIEWVGEAHQSYVPLIKERFSAARGVAPGVVKAGADLSNVPATFSTGDAAELIAIADGAISGGGWVVFGFHGVGGDHTPVTAEAHEALLAHLDERRADIYVATFGEMAACLAP